MTHDEAASAVAKHGSQTKAAAALGVGRKTIRRALERVGDKPTPAGAVKGGGKSVPPFAAKAVQPRKGRSLADFRRVYDKDLIIPARIRAAIKELGAGGWEYEQGFVKIAGVSTQDLGNYRDQFADHIVTIKERRAWAGSKETATKMRSML